MSEMAQHKKFDTIVIGAGALGLWACRHAILEGRTVCLVERDKPGAGASGGVLGALMSHQPDNWNQKKAFQFQALDCLEQYLEHLRQDTGLDGGYRRCGRLMPVRHEKMKVQVGRWLEGSKKNWRGRYSMSYLKPDELLLQDKNWPALEFVEHGACLDTIAARCDPRKIVSALSTFVQQHAECRFGQSVSYVEADQSRVVLEDGTAIEGSEIVVANGLDAYRLLEPYLGPQNQDASIGRGVRGQAVVVEYKHDDDLPILYRDGVYVVPHEGNRMAIGSTSHNLEIDEIRPEHMTFDEQDMGFYHQAVELAPILKDAPIIEKWAGIRPRNTLIGRGADPYFRPVPGHANMIALIGGFKITFGIAHLAMDVARGRIEGP